MRNPLLIFAEVTAGGILNNGHSFSDSGTFEFLVVFGALAVATLVATIFVVIYSQRKKSRKHHRRHHSYRSHEARPNSESSEESEGSTRRKWKRQRRPHRPMNPTLSQTRGLPPLRGENAPPPP